MSKNVLLPLLLLKRIIELLEYIDVSNYDIAIRDDYTDILWELKVKIQKLELREAYANIVQASDEDARFAARMEYLWQKNRLGDV